MIYYVIWCYTKNLPSTDRLPDIRELTNYVPDRGVSSNAVSGVEDLGIPMLGTISTSFAKSPTWVPKYMYNRHYKIVDVD